jgi:hypothetical protein
VTQDGKIPSVGSPATALDPYGARVVVFVGTKALEPQEFLTALLEDVALSCENAGATIIAHLKGFLRLEDRLVSCNLTSVRRGAACREKHGEPFPPRSEMELDLAVLVFGLPAAEIDALVGDALERLLSPLGSTWTKHVPC